MKVDFYFASNACSLASHAVLEEVGIEFTPHMLNLGENQQRQPEYLAINPQGRVPALVIDGTVITENPAILELLADLHPQAGLLPEAPIARARVRSYCNWIAASVHVMFAHNSRPARYVDDETMFDAIRAKGRAAFRVYLGEIDGYYQGRDFAFGDKLTIADFYSLVMWRWTRRVEIAVGTLPALDAAMLKLQQRPSVQRALTREGLPLT
jgi:glutathione S-transferase